MTKNIILALSIVFLFTSCVSKKEVSHSSGKSEQKNSSFYLSPEVIMQKGHTDRVNSISYAKNRDYFVTASSDNSFKIWAETGLLLQSVNVGFEIAYAEFFNDDQDVFVAGELGKYAIYDRKGKLKYFLPDTEDRGVIWSAAVSPDGKYFLKSTSNYGLYLINQEGYTTIQKPGNKSSGMVISAIFSGDSKSFFTGDSNGEIKKIDLDGNIISKKTLNNVVRKMARHKSGKIAMFGNHYWSAKDKSKFVKNLIWSEDGNNFTEFTSEPLNGGVFSDDGKNLILLATDLKNSHIIIADEKGAQISKFNSQHHYIKSTKIAISHYNLIISVGDGDSLISSWNMKGKLLHYTKEDFAAINSIDSNPNYGLGIALSNKIRIINNKTSASQIIPTNQTQNYLTSSANGELLASGGDNLFIWNAEGKLKQKLPGHKKAISQIAFSKDNQKIFTVGGDGYFNEYDADAKNNFHLKKRFKFTDKRGEAIAMHPTENKFVVADDYKKIQSYDFKGTKLWEYEVGRSVSLSYSPDGKYIAVLGAYEDKDITILNSEGELIKRLSGFNKINTGRINFSPSGKYLVSTGIKHIIVWSVDDWKLVTIFKNDRSQITNFAFMKPNQDSPIIIGSRDSNVVVWDIFADQSKTVLFKGNNARFLE